MNVCNSCFRFAICRDLPAELAAASRLTSLVFKDPDVHLLTVAHDTLPHSLQRLRVTEDCRMYNICLPRGDMEATAPCPPRDFAGLLCVQQLQLTVYGMGSHLMPTGWVLHKVRQHLSLPA